jgi:RNA polymerase sigma-70 factor, ECF subfamily
MEITSIHREFHTVLHNYVAKRVNNLADVEDLVQEVFVKINDRQPESKEKLKSWLFTVTRNTIIDFYRKNKGKGLSLDDIALDNLREEEAFDQTKELEGCVHRFIEQLPDEYREIIIDSELKGVKQKDLSEKYNLAYPTVRSRVQRGRARLKQMFLDCCRIELDKRGNILSAIPRANKC